MTDKGERPVDYTRCQDCPHGLDAHKHAGDGHWPCTLCECIDFEGPQPMTDKGERCPECERHPCICGLVCRECGTDRFCVECSWVNEPAPQPVDSILTEQERNANKWPLTTGQPSGERPLCARPGCGHYGHGKSGQCLNPGCGCRQYLAPKQPSGEPRAQAWLDLAGYLRKTGDDPDGRTLVELAERAARDIGEAMDAKGRTMWGEVAKTVARAAGGTTGRDDLLAAIAVGLGRLNPDSITIDVPGCTCETRTQEQLDRVDVCDACVSYFDLWRGR